MADITYLRTWEGWLYLAAVQDVYSRRIVGWAMADHTRSELVVDALHLRTEVFDYVEIFYNRRRRHRSLGMLSPAEFETITHSHHLENDQAA